MKFNYNFLAISLLGAMAVGCEPMEDIYDEIDAEETIITKSVDEYVLTKADYEAIGKAASKAATTDEEKDLAKSVTKKLALNEFASADKFVPALLTKMYSSWGKGSTVGVTYDYYNKTEGLASSLRGIKSSFLSNNDYEQIWANDGMSDIHFLSPKHAPEVELPIALAKKFANAKENDRVLVDYKYDSVDPTITAGDDLFSQDFAGIGVPANKGEVIPVEIEGWKQIQIEGDRTWQGKEFSSNRYAQMSAFRAKGKQEVALVTAPVAITTAAANLTFDLKFGFYTGDCFTVFVSDKYKGEDTFDASKWNEVTSSFKFPEGVKGDYSDWANCGNASLAAYNGKKVYFAFVYRGAGDGVSTTVQLDNIKVTTTVTSETNEQKYNALYEFNGSEWKLYNNPDAAVVAPADYDAMGAPGSHDNFSSSVKATDYLPTFLAMKFPYAKVGDTKAVVYKFYTGKETRIYTDEYLNGSEGWALNSYISTREKETFLHNGEKWVFDPSISYEIIKADYEYLISWVKENKPTYMDKKYDNTEYWFGGSSHYMNFNTQLFKRRDNDPEGLISKDDAEAKKYMDQKIGEGLQMVLTHNFPNAETQMNGVDLHYIAICKVYDGATNFRYAYKFKSLGNGKFELVGEPKVTIW